MIQTFHAFHSGSTGSIKKHSPAVKSVPQNLRDASVQTSDGSFVAESVQRNHSLTRTNRPDSMLQFSLVRPPRLAVHCVESAEWWRGTSPGQLHPDSQHEALLSWKELSCNVVCWLTTVCTIVWERGRAFHDSPLPETRLNERTNKRMNERFWTILLAELTHANWIKEKNHEIHH